jgi:c(7)-type cytochrome triheme protein
VSLLFVAAAAAGVLAGGRDDARLPADLVFEREVGPEQAVVFRHWTHVEFASWSCLPCHPAPFRLLRPERRAEHEAMNAGRSCGACHNAREAFGTADEASCETCHVGRADPPPPAPARPGELHLAGEDSPAPVTFSHRAHLRSGAPCAACHPQPFASRAGASGGEFHERCGGCHDGTAAFAVDEACETCHAPGGAGS